VNGLGFLALVIAYLAVVYNLNHERNR